MDSEFPDPDDEFDFTHEEEYELLKELEDKDVRKDKVVQNVNEVVRQSSQSAQPSTSNASSIKCNGSIFENGCIQNGVQNSAEGGKKRTFEQLFGDITDLVEDDNLSDVVQPMEKKQKIDQDELMIEKIRTKRSLNKRNDNHSLTNGESRFTRRSKKDSISSRVPTWNFIRITRSSDHQRLYIRVRDANQLAPSKHPTVATGLVSVPFQELKEEAKQIMRKNHEFAESLPQPLPSEIDANNDELWVDKYRPKKYKELLSEEAVNRALLQWMKLWDKVVFKRDPVIVHREKFVPKFGSKKFVNKNIEGLDSKGFPSHRIVLLSGPPGLGKTTLAHIAARHAGYNVVEVNSSDDRGPEAFRQALVASTQMKAMMGADPRPNCLILDEIDGAPAASIDLLIKFVQGKLITKSKKNKGNVDQEKDSAGCRRPVICICNEVYTPSLRALRMIALTITVQNVSPARLAQRLMEIAEKEGLNVDSNSLLQLAERSGCDIRTCLGVLQFSGGYNLNKNLALGFKDARKGLFDVWREILQIPTDRNGQVPVPKRVGNILKILQQDETERIAQGIFHNYPEVGDVKMVSLSTALEWFQFFDQVSTFVTSRQAWTVMPYTNYAFVAWHLNIAVKKAPKLSYPSAMTEANQKLARNRAIVTSVQRASGRDALSLITDLAPLLPELLTPHLRSLSGHLYSGRERMDLARLVNVMLDLGLTFVQEKTPDKGYEYVLEPNLYDIGVFPDCKPRRSLTYAVKQIVVREVEVERLRRLDLASRPAQQDADARPKKTAREMKGDGDAFKAPPDKSQKPDASPELPNHLKTLKAPVPEPEAQQYRDFFGRVITVSPEQKKQRGTANVTSPQSGNRQAKHSCLTLGFYYKYKEGFCNAVRRRVTMEELL